jgi:23S rRNA pseudouridine2605 synthase
MGAPLLYDIHGKRFSGHFSASSTNRGLLRQVANLNQQQLQNARTALWRQNGQPLLTQDDAAAWLDQMGICLFLPRHAQLPAPAASFVEACSGAGRAVPTPAAIDEAMALVTRLVAEGRAVPLNLMGNLTEQPDFLVTAEALRWIAAVRGDRNWKAAPGGRTAPLVRGVWSALDRAPGRPAAGIREELGRELTEGAVMRALVELWTTLRAAPDYAAGDTTRWSLMRDRYAREMAAGANTSQTTALSALISLYVRQVVAATAEEAEIFLSPLTARSRIREVVHGMLATRQFETMPMGVQTLLYLEGALPEVAETESTAGIEPAAATGAPLETGTARADRVTERKPWNAPRPVSRPESRREPQPRRPIGRGPKREGRPAPGERRDSRGGEKRPFRPGQKPDWQRRAMPGTAPGSEPREFRRPGGKPWEKREGFRGRGKENEAERELGPRRGENQGGGEFGKRRQANGGRGERKAGGWQATRRSAGDGRNRDERNREERGRDNRRRDEHRPEGSEIRPEPRREPRSADRGRGQERPAFRRDNRGGGQGSPEFRRRGAGRANFGEKPGGPGSEERGRNRFGKRSGEETRPRPGKPGGRFGKPGAKFGKPGGRFGKPGGQFGKSGRGRFGKPGGKPAGPGLFHERRPWKNRPDKNGPKGPGSGKNRKGQEDQPE